MSGMDIALIYAAAENGVIGNAGVLPWRIRGDMRHFRKHTLGKAVIMGRRTWESLSGALSGRCNIVLSHRLSAVEGGFVARDVKEALDLAVREHGREQIMVIGGAQIYHLFESRALYIYLTRVHKAYEGDSVFHLRAPEAWDEVSRVRHDAGAGDAADYSFIELARRV